MKKRICAICLVASLLFSTTSVFALLISVMFASPAIGNEKIVEIADNYETFTATVEEVISGAKGINLVLKHENKSFEANFSITGSNLQIAKQNGIDDALKKDDIVTVTALQPIVNSDLRHSIVAISNGETTFLLFAEGRDNLVGDATDVSNKCKILLVATASVFVVSVVGFVISKRWSKKLNLFK